MGSKSLAHNVRLFNLEPRAAHGLCLDPSSEILALARTRNENSGSGGNSEDDSSEEEEAWIEIWSLPWLPTGESSLEALAFGSGGRIYSTAHEIKSGALKKIPVNFHVKSQRLAVGTEEGVVCLFRENAAGLVYEKCLDKQEGRILCIAWEPNLGNKLVTGSTDTLRIWDTTSFWNGKTGTLLDSYQTHKADVLTVAVNHEKNIAYSTGVDPVVMHFQPILHKDGRSKWIKSIHKTWNHHDNRSILPIDPNTLALVGIDSFLRFVAPKNKYVYAPLPYGESVSLSPDIRCLLFRYSNSLELWKLGSTKEDSKTALSGAILKMDEGPTNILKLANKDGRTIRCSDISDSGKFLGYAIQASTRIYALSLPQNGTKTEPCLSRIKSEEKWPNIHHMKFISGTNKCLLLNQMGNVTLLNILEEEDGEFYLQKESEISRDRTKLNSGISKFHIQGEYLAVADYDDNVVVVNYESGLLISQFPKYTHAPVSSLTLSQHKTLLFISYSNGIVVDLDPKETIYDNPTRRTIRGAFYDSENEDKIIFYDSSP
ncbi:Cirhinlike, partial [Caligus rogercresseyi]